MPKHDENRWTAFNAGQEDFIHDRVPSPDRYHLNDDYRRDMYYRGYQFEAEEMLTVVNL